MMRIELENAEKETLVGALDTPQDASERCIVLCHGLLAHRNLGIVARLHRLLAGKGYAVCSFDFSGNGQSEGAFGEATFTKETRDLRAVLDHLRDAHGFLSFALVGHSMGGSVALLAAAEDPRVERVVAIAAPIRAEPNLGRNASWLHAGQRFDPPQGGDLRERAYVLSERWMADARELDIPSPAVPVLGIYGERDRIVPPEEGEALRGLGAELLLIDSDHLFLDVQEAILDRILTFLR